MQQEYTAGMETSVAIPEDVFQQAEDFAASLGVSRDELYAMALIEFMRERRDERITELLNQVYSETESSLDEDVRQLQATSLPPEEW